MKKTLLIIAGIFAGWCVIVLILDIFVAVSWANPQTSGLEFMADHLTILGYFETVVGVFVVYFLPGLLAQHRRAKNKNYVWLLNLLAGWTIIGWIAAFIWAVIDQPKIVSVQPVTYAPAQATEFCTGCGRPRIAGMQFCTACGSPQFTIQAQPTQPTQLTRPAGSLAKSPSRIQYVHHGR